VTFVSNSNPFWAKTGAHKIEIKMRNPTLIIVFILDKNNQIIPVEM
jgi:hypothetical protein